MKYEKALDAVIGLVFLAALMCCGLAHASQNSITLPNTGTLSGLTAVNDINAANNTLATQFSGSTVPGAPLTPQLFINTSTGAIQVYDGSAWDTIGVYGSGVFIGTASGATNQAQYRNSSGTLSGSSVEYLTSTGVAIGTATNSNELDVYTGGIHIGSSTPASTANALYAIGTSLQWNGAAIGAGGGGSGTVSTGAYPQLAQYIGATTVIGTSANNALIAIMGTSNPYPLSYLGTTGLGYMTYVGTSDPDTIGILSTVALGTGALGVADGESDSVAIGNGALGSMKGIQGYYETGGYAHTGNGMHNVAVGAGSMYAASANGCTANGGAGSFTVSIGTYAGYNQGCAKPYDNTFVGDHAGYSNTTGTANTIIGGDADGSTSGSYNTFIGYQAGGLSHVTTGNSSIIIGNFVGSTTFKTGTNDILWGNGTGVDTPAAGTGNYMNTNNWLLGDMSKGFLMLEGPAPAVSSCGTSPTLVTGSNNMVGEVTAGTGATTCTITFSSAYHKAPFCNVTSQSGVAIGYTESASTLVVTGASLTASNFDYHCIEGVTTTNQVP